MLSHYPAPSASLAIATSEQLVVMAGSSSNIKEEVEMSMVEEMVPGIHGQDHERLRLAGEDPLKCPFPRVPALVYLCWRSCVCR